MIKIEIKNRWTGSILFHYEKENNTVLKTLKQAIKEGADLRNADLEGADLEGADLEGADLEGADLRSADLEGADLEGANLEGANLEGANLRNANLRSANLEGANLEGANLRSANLRNADLEPIKKDLFDVLLRAIPEVEFLRQAVINGKINGSTYTGECACLFGTLMKSENKSIVAKVGLIKNSSRPIEMFFMNININDTPENSHCSKIVLDWIEEFQSFLL